MKIKIAIIGAGPSGFGAAEALRNNKYKDRFEVTIYEKNDYVGGKCCTVNEHGQITNGKPGGYEMGATIIAKHTPSYRDVSELIDNLDVQLLPFKEQDRPMFRYIKNKKVVPIRQLEANSLLHKPKKYFRALQGYEQYAQDYVRYSLHRPVGYVNRPKTIATKLSKKYDQSVYTRLSGIMQGFGYADLDDKHLTPPTLYYHQYIEPSVLEFPTYIVERGTQSIWSTLANQYPKHTIRLNTIVQRIERHPDSVKVITKQGAKVYDYLIVATPLKPALEYLDLEAGEKTFLKKMKHNNYVSVLCRAENLGSIGIFNLPACTKRSRLGDVVFAYQRYPDSDHIVAYLYLEPASTLSDREIINKVEQSLNKDYGLQLKDKRSAKVFHWDDYFGHLDSKTIKQGWYEHFEKYIQGKNRTLFVSSGLHMETVGASFQYGKVTTKHYFEQTLGIKFNQAVAESA